MYLVSEICLYTKNKAKVKLDNGFTFALYKGEIKKYKIKENNYVEEYVLQEILDEVLYKRAKERVLYLLKDSAKTKKQIRDKLKQGYYPEIVIEKVIDFLERYSYINDYEYALNYIDNNSKRKSLMQIRNNLYVKGVNKELIDSAISASIIDDKASIDKLIEKKIKGYDLNNPKHKRRFYSLLQRNGYSYDLITKVLREY